MSQQNSNDGLKLHRKQLTIMSTDSWRLLVETHHTDKADKTKQAFKDVALTLHPLGAFQGSWLWPFSPRLTVLSVCFLLSPVITSIPFWPPTHPSTSYITNSSQRTSHPKNRHHPPKPQRKPTTPKSNFHRISADDKTRYAAKLFTSSRHNSVPYSEGFP